jgi:predicted nucleic acid-binding protein
MNDPVFVDTNVFIYALDNVDSRKQQAAQAWRSELWMNGRGRTSFQVLQEFFAKVVQKWPAAREDAKAEVRDLLAWHPVVIDSGILEQGWKIQERFHLSFWDALIVAAAKAAACKYLLTEDLQPDQDLGGVLVVSPFLHAPASILSP